MKNSDFLVSGHGPVRQVKVNFYGCVSLINPKKREVYERNADTTLGLMVVTWCCNFLC